VVLAQSTPPEALLSAIAQSGNAVTQGWMRLLASPPDLQALQGEYLEQQKKLWNSLLSGNSSADEQDRRFAAREWRDNPYYAYLKHSYLLASRYLEQAVESAPLEGAAKERARFAARQWIDAMCPANFAATNPSVLKQALESQGESITRGMANLLADAGRGRISQTDESAFELGRNIASTPGEVVYENDLVQLIQYRARTAEVAKRPLVMIPPCINKYYILDLQPENSFAGYAVDRGHTVFMVSWRNVGPEQGHYGWDDYLELGVLKVLRVAQDITEADKVNALGFCVGGTLLGAALAQMASSGDTSVSSVTLLAAMLDFSDTGHIGLFVDETSVAAREATIGKGGILPGQDLAFVFSSLRANDLIWPYVVNNYLLGGRPAAFDLLYWNADSTNLPGPMYCHYLRHAYLQNDLKDLYHFGKVKLPMFGLATREDHIVPWRSAYRTLNLLGGSEKQFILGASGHIAGVVNPASKNRRSYWIGDPYPADADEWLERAQEQKGSWWPRWAAWLDSHGGGKRKAPQTTGNAKYKAIEPAPGRYVRHRIH
jgi:polyhydroxyalkanoate synthase subunit PhaC